MAKISTDKKKSLRGVVLIMVVTVMFVLIIMLLATLSVVSTAQNRYYTKYEENQAYFSARSALDICLENSFIDSDYYAYDSSGVIRQFSYTESDGSVSSEDMKQGLAIQLDTYRIKAHSDTIENYEAMTDKTQFSTDFWANAGAGGDTVFTADPEKSYYEDPDLNYIEYKVQLPRLDNGTNQYGVLVDQPDPTDPSTQMATIRVEVLARTYDGHNANLPAEMAANPGNAAALKSDDILSVGSGSRHKDKIYYKITAIVQCNGVEQSASVVYSTPDEDAVFTGAITARGSIGGIDNGVIIDGYATPDPVQLGNMGVYVGQSYAGADVKIPNGGSTIPMGKGQCTFIESISEVQNNFYPEALGVSATAPERDTPVVLVNDYVIFNNQIIWAGGSSAVRERQVDLVVRGDFTAGGDLNFNGNIIVGGDFYLNGNNISMSPGTKIIVGGTLYLQNINILGGLSSVSIYAAGDVDLGSNDISRFPTTIFMQSGKTVKANSGNIYDTQSTGDITDALGNNSSTYQIMTSDANPFDTLDVTLTPTTEGAEIFIPTIDYTGATPNLRNTNGDMDYVRYAPCEASKYYTFWKRDSVAPYPYLVDGTGNHIFLTAEEMAGTTKQSDRDIGNYTVMSFSPPAGSTAISSGTIDVTGEKDFILSPGNRNIRFTGSGTANVFVTPGYYAGKISSEDKTKINFYFPSGNYTWNVANYTDSIYSGFSGGLRFGENDTSRLPPPKIHFYISAGSVVNNDQAGWGMFSGYIYAPDATINTTKGLDGFSYSYYYDGDLIRRGDGSTMSSNPIVIGSVVCQHFTVSQNSAVCFIKPEKIYEAGEPFFDSTDNYYYARR